MVHLLFSIISVEQYTGEPIKVVIAIHVYTSRVAQCVCVCVAYVRCRAQSMEFWVLRGVAGLTQLDEWGGWPMTRREGRRRTHRPAAFAAVVGRQNDVSVGRQLKVFLCMEFWFSAIYHFWKFKFIIGPCCRNDTMRILVRRTKHSQMCPTASLIGGTVARYSYTVASILSTARNKEGCSLGRLFYQ